MSKHEYLNLELSGKQVNNLEAHNRKILQHLEKRLPLDMKVLKALVDDLSGLVAKNRRWKKVLQQIHDSGDHTCLHLLHNDNEILNLPWSMAVDPVSGQTLGSIKQLYLAKSIPHYLQKGSSDFILAPAPLKILILVSSPEDPDEAVNKGWEKRLAYEEEERLLLEAFAPLMQTGQVEIDFCEDGSLETLERKLKANKYHILHVSGHAEFKEEENTGYLQLENPLTLKSDMVTARDFAGTVNGKPGNKPDLVVLSSCQTAKGSTEKGLSGVTNHLLRIGVPAVVSMGMSIKDNYAARFAAFFYSRIARQESIYPAFHRALEEIKESEYNDLLKARVTPAVPLQWIIPNLYLSRPLDRVVDWDQPQEKLELSSNRYIFEKDLLLLKHEREYLFVGRRREKAVILGPLLEKKPVLLKGQGGVGKTAMAEHLVQRLIAANPKTIPFVFNEKIKSLKEILEIMQNFLMDQGHMHVVSEINRFDKGMDKFRYLVFTIANTYKYRPVFVFDNLETFQAGPGQELAAEFSDIKEILDFLCSSGKFHVILTCRYPVPDFKDLLPFDLNQVGLNDTWKKCLYMDVGHLHTYLREAAAGQNQQTVPPPSVPFIDIVKLLHRTFGGNYRALEFFNRWLRENPGKIKSALDSLESFQQETREAVADVRQQMGQSLMFSRLVALLAPGQLRLLDLLSHFRVPVQPFALELQGRSQKSQVPVDLAANLEPLHRLTLMEISLNRETDAVYYYVTPLVKDLLAGYRKEEERVLFSHEQAGVYYYHVFYNVEAGLTPLEEAFYHFDTAADKEKIREIGDRLSGIYYGFSLFRSAYFYARRVYEVWGEETTSSVLNLLGLIYDLNGDYDRALDFYQKDLKGCRRDGDKVGEGTSLNNISQIYSARGDYATALHYLEQSLKIRQEIGDKAGEGTALNNISQIWDARGDYATALHYLEQSLKIRQEIGDKAGEGTTLNNISGIYRARGDYATALHYLEQSLKISREIGDKAGEGATLNNISQIFKARGDYATALHCLEQSLKIRQEIGDKAGEGATLNNMATTAHARGDYATALHYLEQSLKIRQEIGDKSGSIPTLHNMASIALKNEDIKKFMEYETKAYQIALETEDAMGLYNVGRDLGYVMAQQGNKKEGLRMLKKSLEIGKAAGFPDVGQIEEILREFGE